MFEVCRLSTTKVILGADVVNPILNHPGRCKRRDKQRNCKLSCGILVNKDLF